MLDLLRHTFGWICGQYPAHTWSPGGELLPLCQRCTGVYAGAFVAALLHLAQRPVPTPRWMWLNGAFQLFIIPSGFYWIPQNPELRCASGILFGFGLIAFLWLPLPFTSTAEDHSYKTFTASLIMALVGTPLLAEYGNGVAAGILVFACTLGALALAVLLLVNGWFLVRWLKRGILRHSA